VVDLEQAGLHDLAERARVVTRELHGLVEVARHDQRPHLREEVTSLAAGTEVEQVRALEHDEDDDDADHQDRVHPRSTFLERLAYRCQHHFQLSSTCTRVLPPHAGAMFI